jgi:hypothetical protein
MAGAYSAFPSERLKRAYLQPTGSALSAVVSWEIFAHTQIIENISGSAPAISNSAAVLYLTSGILNRVDAVSNSALSLSVEADIIFQASGQASAVLTISVTGEASIIDIIGQSPAASNSSAGLYLTSGILNRVDAVSGAEFIVSLNKLLTGTVLGSTNGSFTLRLNKLRIIAETLTAVSDAKLRITGITAVKIKIVIMSGGIEKVKDLSGTVETKITIGGLL